MSHYVGAATSLVLLQRMSTISVFDQPPTNLLLAGILFALLGVVAWVVVTDQVVGRPFWIWGTGSLAMVAIVSGDLEASLAWGSMLILSGAVLELSLLSFGRAWVLAIPFLGLWGVSGLPFSPTWEAAGVFLSPFPRLLYGLILIQAGLIAGFLRHLILEREVEERSAERWVNVIYPLGLVTLPLASMMITWWPWRGLDWITENPWWPGVISLILGVVMWLIFGRVKIIPRVRKGVQAVLSYISRTAQAAWLFIRISGRSLSILTSVLEGEGGVLWAVLFVVLLLSLLTQIDVGLIMNGN